ncbi:MAG: hypothetical protein GYA24_00705, partial [Candidatus Lokiarchaeota archaeon]|nr:hypothetical protein [Candidatus Lokiarchaeota archaeon]
MRLARKGAIDRVKQNELHMDVLRCRSADDADIPVLASIIDKAFAKRGFVGS